MMDHYTKGLCNPLLPIVLELNGGIRVNNNRLINILSASTEAMNKQFVCIINLLHIIAMKTQ